MKLRSNIVLVLITIGCLNASFAEEIGLSVLLEEYKANRDGVISYMAASHALTEVVDTIDGGTPSWIRSVSNYYTDGKQIDATLEVIHSLVHPEDQGTPANTIRKRVMWIDDGWIEYNYSTLPGRNNWGSLIHSEKNKAEYLYTTHDRSPLDGLFRGDTKFIDEILREASNCQNPQLAVLNGEQCYLVEARTLYGEYKVWFNPAYRNSIVEAQVHKTGTDICYGRPINESNVSETKGSVA